jgi:predicted nucleotidyltransferase
LQGKDWAGRLIAQVWQNFRISYVLLDQQSVSRPDDEELLNVMVQAVVDTVEPERVVLFGSRARGTARPNSDVDFLVIEDAPFGPERRRQEAAKVWRVLAKFGVPTDVLMYSPAEVEEWRHSPNHGIARALAEGRVVYERSQADYQEISAMLI